MKKHSAKAWKWKKNIKFVAQAMLPWCLFELYHPNIPGSHTWKYKEDNEVIISDSQCLYTEEKQ